MRAMQRVAATAVIGLSAVLGAGLQASAQIKIGAVLSVTGPASFLGDPEKRTLEIYVDEINAKGGVNGQKLRARSSMTTPAMPTVRAPSPPGWWKRTRSIAVIGPSTTGSTLAMMPVFEDAHIPLISFAGAVQIIQPVRKWVFKTPATDTMACEKIFADLGKPAS